MKFAWQDDHAAFILELKRHDYLPSRMAVTDKHKYLHPDAPPLPDWLVISDAFRYGLESLQTRRRKGHLVSVARPGFSGHNWGISIDVDLRATMRNLDLHGGWSRKIRELQKRLAKIGWHYIHNEEWHFNFLGVQPSVKPLHHGWRTVDARVKELYGLDEPPDTRTIQGLLKTASHITGRTSMNPGPVDGIHGPHTERAITAFRVYTDTAGTPLWWWSLLSVCSIPTEGQLDIVFA